MLGYLLKRVLLILPTVWLIGSLLFLLSKIIPGSYADRIAEAEQGTIGGISVALNREAYLKKLARAGQDKPLFYFSIRNRAQPDTLYRVYPVQYQQLLQTLLNRYGNWSAVAAYYHSLQALQTVAAAEYQEENNMTGWPEKVQLLGQTADPEEISFLLQSFPSATTGAGRAVVQLRERFAQLQQQAQPLNLFIPRFRWHGRHNQYHTWLMDLIGGNMGSSYRSQQPVLDVISGAVGNTLLLLSGSLILTFWLSIQLAMGLCRWRYGRTLVLNTLYMLDSTPLFIVALVLLTLLAGPGYLNIFPVFGLGGADEPSAGLGAVILTRLHHLLLPALCLVITGLPYITTQLYQVLQQVLTTQYISTARAKGLSEVQVLRRHAFRNALLPLITLFTGYLPAIISGAVTIEVIFAIPGTGRLLVDSVLSRDYPVLIGLVLFIAALRAFSHVLADFLYFISDPRTRLKAA
ncbi:MAG: hypothetical protein JWQ14_87 [Adhaeribacter sp.]|jgi:peptide/nickel transport system permease protein|nr:hypothetical protein [Adhaeribacter sp.]